MTAAYTYTVDLTIADWSATIASTDAADPAAGLWVLDRLTLGWTMPDDRFPAQPDPTSLSLTLRASHRLNAPTIEIGTPVTAVIKAWSIDWPNGDPWVDYLGDFSGRITAATATPTGDGSVEYALTCLDHTNEMAEEFIAAQPWPAEWDYERLDRIGDAGGFLINRGTLRDEFLRALDVDHRTIADVLDEHLSQLSAPVFEGQTWARAYLTFFVDDTGYHFAIAGIGDRSEGNSPPALLGATAAGIGIVLSETTNTAPVFDASYLTYDCAFKKAKNKAVNRFQVAGELADGAGGTVTTVTAQFDDLVAERGPITDSIDDSVLYNESDALLTAKMYLGEKVDLIRTGWVFDEFTIDLNAMTDAQLRTSLRKSVPLIRQSIGAVNPDYNTPGQLILITGLRDSQNLAGQPWIAGRLVGAQLVIEQRDITIRPRLRPGIPRPGSTYSTGAITCANLAAATDPAIAGVTYAGLDPEMTVYDLRLVRSPA